MSLKSNIDRRRRALTLALRRFSMIDRFGFDDLLQRLAAPLIVAFSPGHGFRGGDNMINADEECCRWIQL